MSWSADGSAYQRLALSSALVLGCCCLLCAAQYVTCPPGNYSDQLDQRIIDVNVKKKDYTYDTKCCSASSWVVDEKKGKLGVYFQLPRDGAVVKRLQLEKKVDGKWISYSQARLLPEDYKRKGDEPAFNSSLCPGNESEFGYHTFGYVSTGSYRLKSCSRASVERYINTAFDESRLDCTSTQSTFTGNWSKDGKNEVVVAFQQRLTHMMDRVYMLKDSNLTVISAWSVKARKKDSDRLVCENRYNDSRIKYDPYPDAYSYRQNFLIKNLLPGNYTIEVTPYGQLSVRQTKIGVCTKTYAVEIDIRARTLDPEGTKVSPPQENAIAMVVIGLAAVVVLGSTSFVVYTIIKCIRDSLFKGITKPQDGSAEDALTREKVLLLYARDCTEFQNLMNAFRDLLKDNNFEVYDCYDELHRRQVDEDGTMWMHRLVKSSLVRVVVVSSRCARLHQLARIRGGRVTYQKPEPWDGLFLYALCEVMNIHRNIYKKIFSIALEGFTGKDEILSILTGSRIYTLPNHILELFRDLRHNSVIPDETKELREEVAKLKEKLEILVRHVNTNKDYLRSKIVTY